jgi:hypothetical protein
MSCEPASQVLVEKGVLPAGCERFSSILTDEQVHESRFMAKEENRDCKVLRIGFAKG